MEQDKFSFKKRIRSFKYAIHGIMHLFKYEHNSRIHAFIAIITILAGIRLKITSTEWIIIILCCGAVFAAECLNSAIEAICDFICPQQHNTIKRVKDLAAASVLFIAIAALITGLIIFIPYIIKKIPYAFAYETFFN